MFVIKNKSKISISDDGVKIELFRMNFQFKSNRRLTSIGIERVLSSPNSPTEGSNLNIMPFAFGDSDNDNNNNNSNDNDIVAGSNHDVNLSHLKDLPQVIEMKSLTSTHGNDDRSEDSADTDNNGKQYVTGHAGETKIGETRVFDHNTNMMSNGEGN